MKAMIKKKSIYRTAALMLSVGMVMGDILPLTAYALGAEAKVDETLYLNLDYYGNIDKANVVKSIDFNSQESYTDHGEYTELKNMSTSDTLTEKDGAVVITAPKDGKKFYFQGTLEPKKVSVPWSIDVTYKLNGVVSNAEDIAGKSGLVEIDIDAMPNENVSEYMRNNFILMVAIPVDNDKYYSVDAPDSQVANVGEYSCVVFEALPGKEGHFAARFGTDCFETVGAIIMMSPATVGDLKDVKDLKELKDKFRDNTNAMLDDVESIMDNVTNVSEQLTLTNQMLQNLQEGKNKIHSQTETIFNGNDVAIQDLRDLSGLLTPLDGSLKTAQWFIYDINKNLNTLNQDLVDTSGKMKTLSSRLKSLGSAMDGVDGLSDTELKAELSTIIGGLSRVTDGIKESTGAAANIGAITGSGEGAENIDNLINNAGILSAAKGYLPSAVIGFVNNCANDGIVDIDADLGDSEVVKELTAMLIAAQYLNDNLTECVPSIKAPITSEKLTSGFNGMVQTEMTAQGITKEEAIEYVITKGVESAGSKYSEYEENAENFIEAVAAVKDLKTSASKISENTAADGTNISQNLENLTEGLYNISEGTDAIDDPEIIAELMGGIADVVADIEEISSYGGAVAFQTARFLTSARNLCADMDALTATMNNYYQDIQDAVTNTDNVLLQIQKTTDDLSGTLQTVNDTIRSAEQNFSNAADEGIEAGKLAVDNTGKIVDNVKDLKSSGADLRKSINDELDEKEAENNFLNMDPEAVKVSLTSDENPEPSSVSIICRTDEISYDDDEAQKILDAEEAEAESTVFERIINVFKKIWNTFMSFFNGEL